ncbi:transposase-like protein%2C IS1239 [Streptococcus pneumoniae]|uniref:helix-turn-helix domain-containing protein n=5 Tax=Streptococcus pneumoniae TaxID=1313 RepID=UPI0005E80F5D|nr:helix-turn-helix domain-containing protein [Streptococcus pneumoniae]CJQ72074.1 transposase-like protein%2C IS1239 [Streptococcus pneumoniae]
MQEHYTPKGKHLTIDNRRLIERWKNENKSNREIAGLLGKAPQTIHNEVKRGTTLQQVRKGLYKKVYSADYAQTVYQFNRKRSLKLKEDTLQRIERLTEERMEISRLIDKLANPLERSVLRLFYLNVLEAWQVAEEIDRSKTTVYLIRQKAIEHLAGLVHAD